MGHDPLWGTFKTPPAIGLAIFFLTKKGLPRPFCSSVRPCVPGNDKRRKMETKTRNGNKCREMETKDRNLQKSDSNCFQFFSKISGVFAKDQMSPKSIPHHRIAILLLRIANLLPSTNGTAKKKKDHGLKERPRCPHTLGGTTLRPRCPHTLGSVPSKSNTIIFLNHHRGRVRRLAAPKPKRASRSHNPKAAGTKHRTPRVKL